MRLSGTTQGPTTAAQSDPKCSTRDLVGLEMSSQGELNHLSAQLEGIWSQPQCPAIQRVLQHPKSSYETAWDNPVTTFSGLVGSPMSKRADLVGIENTPP